MERLSNFAASCFCAITNDAETNNAEPSNDEGDDKQPEFKYTDADVDAIVKKKLARAEKEKANAVAEAEKLEASDEEVDKEVELMAIQYQLEADKIKEMLGMENLSFLKQDIKMRKAVDFMYENAEIK